MAAIDTTITRQRSFQWQGLRTQFARSPEAGALLGFIALILFFSITAGQLFLSKDSAASILTSQAPSGIVAVGIAMLMISGEFDLSVGSILGVSSLVFLSLIMSNVPAGIAAIAGVLAGATMGLINGLILVGSRIPSFIVTLGTLQVYRAISLTAIRGGTILRYSDYDSKGQPWVYLHPLVIIALGLVIIALTVFFGGSAIRNFWVAYEKNGARTTNFKRSSAADYLVLGCAAIMLIIGGMAVGILSKADYASGLPLQLVLPIAGASSLLLILWSIFKPRYKGLASFLVYIAGFAAFVYLVPLFIYMIILFFQGALPNGIGLAFPQTVVYGLALLASIGLVLQIAVPRAEIGTPIEPASTVLDASKGAYARFGAVAGIAIISALALVFIYSALYLALNQLFDTSTLVKISFFDILNGRFIPGEDANFRTVIIWWLFTVLIFTVILSQTRYGSATFATGGNAGAARAQGIAVDRVRITNFVISGALAGLAGVIAVGRQQSVNPTDGVGLELEVIAAAVIGGTLLSGGFGSIIGATLGVLIVGILQNGLVFLHVPSESFTGYVGAILIITVIINTTIRRAR